MRIIVLITLVGGLIGCNSAETDALKKDLDLSQRKVEALQAELSKATAEIASCTDHVEATCRKLDESNHASQAQFFEVGSEYTSVPCVGGFRTRMYKEDIKRGWVYLRYEVGDKTHFSDRLIYAGDKSHRNSLRVDSTLISVESCDGDTGTCSVSCRNLTTSHAPACP